jgi:hypothetical protein
MIIYIALCIIGIYEVTDSLLENFTGKDLGVYYDMLDGKRAQKLLKPVIFCTLCMSSFWGLTLQLGYDSPLMVITNCFAIAGIIRIITAIIDKLDAR